MTETVRNDFSGFKGRVAAWLLTSPVRRLLEAKMGNPDARLTELLQLTGNDTVLDAGCGSGFHSLLLAEALPEGKVVAVDISQEMLDQLGRNAAKRSLSERLEAQLADGQRLPLEDNSVDRALSAAVWHHLDDPQAACDELVRVVKPGGRVVVSDLAVHASRKTLKGLSGHDQAFGPDDMRRIMEQAGLQNVQVETEGRWVLGAGDSPAAA
jgi:ubiquinone/menaquinone biosynthesis C-methylase UbiE